MSLTPQAAGPSTTGVAGSPLDTPEANAARSVVCFATVPYGFKADSYSLKSDCFVNLEDQTTRYEAWLFLDRVV